MWLPLAAVIAAGTFQTESGEGPLRVVGKGGASACYRLAPAEIFGIAGPANLELAVRIDLPARRQKIKPVSMVIELDGELRKLIVTPKRAKRAQYDPPLKGIKPSQATTPIPVAVATGHHRLRLELGNGRTGCVTILGAEPVSAPESEARSAEVTPARLEPAAAASPQPARASEFELEEATHRTPGELAAGTTVETIAATQAKDTLDAGGIELEALPAAKHRDDLEEETYVPGLPDIVRFGPKFGGAFPRGKLDTTVHVGLAIEVPLPFNISLGGAFVELCPYAEGGWSPLSDQRNVIITGRGRTKLIQNTTSLPLEVGLRARFDFDVWIIPVVSIGFAMDVTWTELQIFSLDPVRQDRLAFGGAASLGIYYPVGPGGFFLEGRYREVQTRFSQLDDLAEQIFSAGSAHLSYLFAIRRSAP